MAVLGLGGKIVGMEGLTGERVSPDARDVAGLSTRRNDGRPSLPELFPFADESSLTRVRGSPGLTSSKSVSITWTVSLPSSCCCCCLSSRRDRDRSAEREILDRSEVLRTNEEPEVDAAMGAGAGAAGCGGELWPSASSESLLRVEAKDA
jgi:hypothetical protein